jgi:hypothetical protein
LQLLLLQLLLQLLLLCLLRVWLCTFSSPRSRYPVTQWGESVVKLPAAAERGKRKKGFFFLLRLHSFQSKKWIKMGNDENGGGGRRRKGEDLFSRRDFGKVQRRRKLHSCGNDKRFLLFSPFMRQERTTLLLWWWRERSPGHSYLHNVMLYTY